MIETALLLPILLLLAFNAINFGHFFFVCVNLAAAPRTGVQYSVLGEATPVNIPYPPAGPASSHVSVS
jgi:Flp pilus assembly protein TadG